MGRQDERSYGLCIWLRGKVNGVRDREIKENVHNLLG